MTEAARRATADDIAPIAEILARQAEAIRDHRGGNELLHGELPLAPSIPDMLADPEAVVIAGTYDEVIMGVATAKVQTRANGERIAHISRLVVDEEIRKSGIGESIMNELERWAREQGCVAIESVALPGDRNTKNFFESFGLKARLLVVGRRLD